MNNYPLQTLVVRVKDEDTTALPVAVVEISPRLYPMLMAMLLAGMNEGLVEHVGAVKGWGADLQYLNGDMEHFERTGVK